ncbi:hypothetical protein BMS3Bbin10_02278 [bacterium BMS3Bbin10]|nr:hypothetical protein BMS3Bbin10_02278 [bacterium BMS3Bbin10]HDL16277.1 hypothetical protein [Hyphomicrobiales bacterium]
MTTHQAGAADTVSAKVTGYGISYAVTSILSALLVVLKESNEGVHGLMVAITGHHWVTHGLLDVIVFVALGAVLSRMGGGIRMTGNALIATVVGATVISGAIIAGYFI